ncbi:hypothetical protein PG587_09145 [Riemerella anatipestifer]|uniref:hypothetical protein n=1 Tax=Riemerella anatipestifer TaxID=34085 RepID=UPI0012B2CAC3|nr:hypothetical protein [Riemerella anatipestifer]MDY3507028.1 hypothetical protein [Riemerella anatipestifer]MSN81989.1 hypothetical protein [Riemerella anatipestifer]UXN81042.1 hypothetical protein [Phage vB_RanS_PJN03]
MRKLLLLLTLFSAFVFGQEVTLTADNFKNKEDLNKDYVVLENLEGSNKELFDKVKMFIFSKYKVSKDLPYSEVDGKSIVIDVRGNNEIRKIINMGNNLYRSIVRYELKFKDNKMMIKPYFLKLKNIDGLDVDLVKSGFMGAGLFKKDGSHNKHEDIVKVIEGESNDFIKSIKDYLTQKEDW